MRYPEHEKMKAAKAKLGLETIAEYLESTAECGLLYSAQASRPAWERFAPGEESRLEEFFKFCDANIEEARETRDETLPLSGCVVRQTIATWETLIDRGFDRREPLLPFEQLFAAYAGIDLKKVEEEKRAMLDELRALNERA